MRCPNKKPVGDKKLNILFPDSDETLKHNAGACMRFGIPWDHAGRNLRFPLLSQNWEKVKFIK